MPIMNLRRAIAFPLLAALLAVGGMACIFGGGGGDADAVAERLDAVDERSKRNSAELGLLEQEVDRLTKTNDDLTEQVAQLQQDKNAQAALIQGLQGQTNAGAGIDYATLSDADALAMLIDCQVQAANPGAPDAMIAMATGMAQSTFQAQLNSDTISYDDIRGMLPLACGGQ